MEHVARIGEYALNHVLRNVIRDIESNVCSGAVNMSLSIEVGRD